MKSMQPNWRRVTGVLFITLPFFTAYASADDWPQWRGPMRNVCAPAGSAIIDSLPKELKPVWRISIGGGFSSPVLADGKLVYLDEQDGKEVAHLIDAASGKEIWRAAYANVFQDEWGAGPR